MYEKKNINVRLNILIAQNQRLNFVE